MVEHCVPAAFSSPSLAKIDATSRVPHGSKNASWSRALSPPNSNKLSPLYLDARLKEPNLVNCERDSEASAELVAKVRLSDVSGKGVSVIMVVLLLIEREESARGGSGECWRQLTVVVAAPLKLLFKEGGTRIIGRGGGRHFGIFCFLLVPLLPMIP